MFNLRSKYSILLFQHVASLVNLDHKVSQIFTIKELRGMLGVPEGKLSTWNNLNQMALKPAILEVNQLARFSIKAVPIKDGRHVDGVRISWETKTDVEPVKEELDRSNIGRKVRREGTGETPIAAFPDSGSIRFLDPWERLARENCNWDHGKIADAFRAWCSIKKIALDANRIERYFKNFCAKQKKS